MATMHIQHFAIWAFCVIIMVASSPMEAPAGEEAKKDEKRSGRYCNVNGHYFTHGQVFSLPGYSHCIKYRCNDGGYSIVQSACERNGQCTPVGSVVQDGCRSMRCMMENRGNMHYYHMQPTVQDKCDADGKCVAKNRDFTHESCQGYRCVDTHNGGYRFQSSIATTKCQDDNNHCVNVGARYSKYVNGRVYTNCICLSGGGYSCRS